MPGRPAKAARGGSLGFVDAHFSQRNMCDVAFGCEREFEGSPAFLQGFEGIKSFLGGGLKNVGIAEHVLAKEPHQLLGVCRRLRTDSDRAAPQVVLDSGLHDFAKSQGILDAFMVNVLGLGFRSVQDQHAQQAVFIEPPHIAIVPVVSACEVLPGGLREGNDINEADAREALQRLDPLWDELFPAEQARIMTLLVDRVDIGTDGLNVRLRVDGLAGLAREMTADLEAAA